MIDLYIPKINTDSIQNKKKYHYFKFCSSSTTLCRNSTIYHGIPGALFVMSCRNTELQHGNYHRP